MPQSALSPTGEYSHIMMGQDYMLNTSLEVLCKLWQNYSANEFECFSQFILLIIKQSCALFPFEVTTLWSQWPGATSSLITSLQISTAEGDKQTNKQTREQEIFLLCLYLSAAAYCYGTTHWRQPLPLKTTSAPADPTQICPSTSFLIHLLFFCWLCTQKTEELHRKNVMAMI